jgi:ATP-binding cassette subfamily B protein
MTSSFVRTRLLIAVGLTTVSSVLMALAPVLLKWVVDQLAGQASGATLSPFILIGLYVLSEWLARAAGEFRGFVYARTERRMARTMSERLFAHVIRLPFRFHVEGQVGAVTQTLTNGLQGCQQALNALVFTLLPVAAELGTMVIVLSRLDRPAFLVLFCVAVVCYAVAFSRAAKRLIPAGRSASGAEVQTTATMTDGLMAYEAVKCFTAESLVQSRVDAALARTEAEWVQFYRRFAVNGLGVATIFAAFLGSSVLYAIHEVQAGRLTVGTFVLINAYTLQVVRPVETVGYGLQMLFQGLAFLEKLLELFAKQPEDLGPEDAAPLRGPGALEFATVSASYRADRPVLRGVSFRLPAGKTMGVVGASGAGKSTLVRLLVRLMEPDSGQILLDGVPISQLPLARLRRAIAVVPQDTVLFNDTIGYNIAVGKPGCTQEEVEQAAKLAHLHEYIMGLPDKYDTAVGERGVMLSGGERQRVSIARAALKRPYIYLFDEATSSLDSRTERGILENLQEISRNSTTLIIAHRLSTVMHADEIVVLKGGAIVERGAHEELIRERGHYAALWQAQRRRSRTSPKERRSAAAAAPQPSS